MDIKLFRRSRSGTFVTPAGHNVTYDMANFDIMYSPIGRDGTCVSRRFIVRKTGRRYASIDAAIAALIKFNKENP